MSDQLLVLLPSLIAVAAGIFAAVLDAFNLRRSAVLVAAAALGACAAISVGIVYSFDATVIAYDVLIGGGGFSGVAAVIMLLAASTLLGGFDWFTKSPSGGLAAALVALSSAAAVSLAQSVDLVLTLIALESLAICAYALVSQARTPRADEAAMKYVIQGSVATGLFLLGVAILIGLYGGGTSMLAVRSFLGGLPSTPVAGAMALVVAAFAYKLGAFPFHSWAPDTFETAPFPSAGYLAASPKIAAVLVAFVMGSIIFSGPELPLWVLNLEWAWLYVSIEVPRIAALWAILAAGSMIFGNLAALKQASFGRMLGYSGIAQIGYALVGLAVGERAVGVTMLLLASYGVAVLVAFLAAEVLRVRRPGWDGSISGMAGFGRAYPATGVALAVAMFSMTGIPLTAGFMGKLLVFGAAVGHGMTWLVVIGVLGSVVSFGYYGKVLRVAFFDDPEQASSSADSASAEAASDSGQPRNALGASAVALILAGMVLVIGIAPLLFGIEFIQRFFIFG